MLGPIIPYLTTSMYSSKVLINITRYLLPNLFKTYPASALSLLKILSDIDDSSNTSRTFSARISVAAVAVSLGVVNIEDLPENLILQSITHEEDQVRLKAFQILGASKEPLQARTIGLIQEILICNSVLLNAG